MSGTSNFAAKRRLHALGGDPERTVEVREKLSYLYLISRMQRDDEDGLAELFAAWTAGGQVDGASAAAALRLNDVLIQEMVVSPRVLIPGVDPEPDADDGTYGEAWCWISDFTDDEMSELIDLAASGVGDTSRFHGDAAVDGGGADGEVLGDKPEPAPRPRKRKR